MALTMRRCVLLACASALRMKYTLQRCQVALSPLAAAAFRPRCASEITSLTPRSPRRIRLRRNSVQNVSASLGPTFMPMTWRCHSVLTATSAAAGDA